MNKFFFLLIISFSSFFCFAQKPTLLVPAGHTEAISCIAVAENGAYTLTGSQDKKAKLWNKDEKLLRTFGGHPSGLIDVRFSANNNYLLTRCDSLTKVWSLNGALLWEVPTPAMYPQINEMDFIAERYDPALFSPDERFVIVRQSDTTLLARNLISGALTRLRSTHRQNVQFSPDGQQLLVQQDAELVLLDQQLQEVKRFETAQPNGAATFLNNKKIAVGFLHAFPEDAGGRISIYNTNGRLLKTLGATATRWLQPGTAITYDTLYIQEHDSSYTMEIRERIEIIPRSSTMTYARDPIYDSYWDVLRLIDNTSLLYLGNEQRYEIWNTETGQQQATGNWPATPEYPVFLSKTNMPFTFRKPENDTLFLLRENGDIQAQIPGLFVPRRLYGRRTMSWPQPAAILPGSKQLLIGDYTGQLHVFDQKGQYLRPFGNNMLSSIQRIRSYAEPDEWHVFFQSEMASALPVKTVFNWRLGTIEQLPLAAGENRTSEAENNWGDVLDPEDTHRTDKNFLSDDQVFLATAYEDIMMHIAHGSMVFNLEQGGIFVQNLKSRKNIAFRTGLGSVSDVSLTRDNQFLLCSATENGTVQVWKLADLYKAFEEEWQGNQEEVFQDILGEQEQHFDPTPYLYKELTNFNPRTLLLSGGGNDFLHSSITNWEGGRAYILDVDNTFYRSDLNGKRLGTYRGHEQELLGAEYFLDDQFIVSWSKNQVAKIWNTQTQEELATLYFFGNSDWVLTTKEGLFDGSQGGLSQLYYVIDTEIIELEQLKTRYYEPGLLQKLLAYSNERIRPVEGFANIPLYPELSASIKDNTLSVRLKERNGGIGKLSIFINGKEVVADANPPSPQRANNISYDLLQHKKYFLQNSINTISLRTQNEEGWLKSPVYQLEYTTPPAGSKGSNTSTGNTEWSGQFDPKLYVISIGTSDYSGTQMDLRYADQDAIVMARAFASVGTALFTNGDSLQVHCFSTANTDSLQLMHHAIDWHFANKKNIETVFTNIKNKAKAEDVIVVYLSGHGTTYGSTEEAQFHYLTHGIANDDLSDLAIREAYTISSEELTRWINDIPALKQVLIIDACNSGQVVKNLTGGTKSLNSSQIRALDRMKDRTGMFVLSGSASDKVSYEASEYGQGLLTYALLHGMLGVATRKDPDGREIIDVMTLFQYARDQVPKLASSINGIQTPMLGAPRQAASFDIGMLNEQVKRAIPIGNKKPVVVKSIFMNKNTFLDDLKLAELLEISFREETEKGSDADLIYVDVYDYPGAYSLSGLYEITDQGIEIQVKLFKDHQSPVDLQLRATDNPKTLARFIAREMKKQLRME